jgi:hypothetical protein
VVNRNGDALISNTDVWTRRRKKLFAQERTSKRRESCCGPALASDRISARNAWPRARHRSREFRRPAESARLLPDRQIPSSRHISRSDSRLWEFASSSGLSAKRASFKLPHNARVLNGQIGASTPQRRASSRRRWRMRYCTKRRSLKT